MGQSWVRFGGNVWFARRYVLKYQATVLLQPDDINGGRGGGGRDGIYIREIFRFSFAFVLSVRSGDFIDLYMHEGGKRGGGGGRGGKYTGSPAQLPSVQYVD